ncbi:hypothetical protein [Persicobacter psychrovividus]|uniref:Thiamine phosphate synthase n=1 Tax=Persicobacter psychrovividus TaxID=387638 RepID=A0ABN6L6W0_9BACT|nr:thiamine phosphate synthase [Persicobacter psychrovividus]
MKVRLISPTHALVDEAALVRSLFDQGLHAYHWRKAPFKPQDFQDFLKQLPMGFHQRIWVHLSEIPAESIGEVNIHAKGELAEQICAAEENEQQKMLAKGNQWSTGAHTISALNARRKWAPILLVSPVFPSISKNSYQPEDANFGSQCLKIFPDAVALGGVGKPQIPILKDWGFKSCALMGSIWAGADEPLENFKQIMTIINES